jgi:hypothetical protein
MLLICRQSRVVSRNVNRIFIKNLPVLSAVQRLNQSAVSRNLRELIPAYLRKFVRLFGPSYNRQDALF